MTPFAQLQAQPNLKKSAAPLKAIHGLMRHGLWKTVARKTNPAQTGWKGRAGRAARLFHDPTAGKVGKDGFRQGKSTNLAKALNVYGFGGMGASMMGYDVPGHNLALNAAMPGMGALYALPGAITTGRMASKDNQEKLKEDVTRGARTAGADLLDLARADSNYLTQPGSYSNFMANHSPGVNSLANKYQSGNVKPMSAWKTMGSALMDPQSMINNKVDQTIAGMLGKSGSFEKSGMSFLRAAGSGIANAGRGLAKSRIGQGAKATGRGAKHALPWAFPTLGVGMIGHAATSEKPYDENQAMERGYAGAQAQIQNSLGNLSGFERMALRVDPTLLASKMESKLPGTLKHWSQQHGGEEYRPGVIAKTVDNWSKGGDHDYYEYDAAGQRHYI